MNYSSIFANKLIAIMIEKRIKHISQQEHDLEKKYSKGNYKLYIETYGCQMNIADSEVVVSILHNENFAYTDDYKNADLILINTCSIRENAEKIIINRLEQ